MPQHYGARPRLSQYRDIERQQAQQGPSITERVAAGVVSPGLMGYNMAKEVWDRIKSMPEWLPSAMQDPLNPQSQKDLTELMVDVATPGSSRFGVGSVTGIFGGLRAKVKPPMQGKTPYFRTPAVKGSSGKIYEGELHPTIKAGMSEQELAGVDYWQGEGFIGPEGFVTRKDAKNLVSAAYPESSMMRGSGDLEQYKGFRWFQNPYDKKWRFEIDDSKMKWNTDVWHEATLGGGKDVKLGNLIDHPELFDAYPELRDITVRHTPGKGGGDWNADKKRIRIGAEMPPKETLIHEIQHPVQDIEGFARGGSPAAFGQSELGEQVVKLARKKIDPKIKAARAKGDTAEVDRLRQELYEITSSSESEGYMRLAGEIESREAAGRMGLTAQERSRLAPFKDAIPPEQAIVRFDKGIAYQKPKRYGKAGEYGVNVSKPKKAKFFENTGDLREPLRNTTLEQRMDMLATGGLKPVDSLNNERFYGALEDVRKAFDDNPQAVVKNAKLYEKLKNGSIADSELDTWLALTENQRIQSGKLYDYASDPDAILDMSPSGMILTPKNEIPAMRAREKRLRIEDYERAKKHYGEI